VGFKRAERAKVRREKQYRSALKKSRTFKHDG